MQTCAVSYETILATRQELFFREVAPVQSITNIDFCLMLLSWMFVSSYAIIYFLVKKFIFSNVYISVKTIFKCFYMFFGWEERDNQLITYAIGHGMGVGKCKEVRSLVSKLICTHIVSCWSRSHEIMGT